MALPSEDNAPSSPNFVMAGTRKRVYLKAFFDVIEFKNFLVQQMIFRVISTQKGNFMT